MIVAIINQTVPVGVKRVEEFREAVDEATAVVAYCNGYTPPRNVGDYLGFDSGWSSFQPPAPFNVWGYDFAAPGLVQIPVTPEFELKASSQILNAVTPIVDVAFAELGGIVAAPSLLVPELSSLVIRLVGLYRTTLTGAKLRVCQDGVAVSLELALTDTLGAWTTFTLNTNVAPSAGLHVYTLEGLLGAAALAELKYVSFNLLRLYG
jgi:hypothetical protein